MTKKNILILASTLHIGGAEMMMYHLAKNLDNRRFNVTVCFLKEGGLVADLMRSVEIRVIGLEKPSESKVNYFSAFQLLKVVRKLNIDLIHSHTIHSLTDSAIVRLLKPRVKIVHTFHFGNYPNLEKKYYYMEKIFSKFHHKLIAVGYEQKKKIDEVYCFNSNKIHVIHNGIEIMPSNLDFGKNLKAYIKPGYFHVGTTSTLIEQKGITYLIDVACELVRKDKKVRFLVAGDGYLKDELTQKIKKAGIQDNVILLGWIEDAAKKLLPLVDIFFLPSLWEAMSISVLEAMAAGKAIICTDVGDNRNVLIDGESGYIVPVKSTTMMIEKMEYFIGHPDEIIRFGRNAFERFQNNYTVDHMVENYQTVYSKLLD